MFGYDLSHKATTSHRYELRHVVVSDPKTGHDMDLILDNRGRGENDGVPEEVNPLTVTRN